MTPAEFTDVRKAMGMTQPALAQAMGVSTRTIASIEGGTDVPKVYQLAMYWLDSESRDAALTRG